MAAVVCIAVVAAVEAVVAGFVVGWPVEVVVTGLVEDGWVVVRVVTVPSLGVPVCPDWLAVVLSDDVAEGSEAVLESVDDSIEDSEAVAPVSLVEESVLDELVASAVEEVSVLVPVGSADDSCWDGTVVEERVSSVVGGTGRQALP